MNVLQNLTQLYNQLPSDSTYKDVAGKILTNLEEVSNATIYDAAELTNASRTTLWRLVQKMGYENYSDFRHALKQAVSQYTYYNRILLPEQCTDADTIMSSCLHQTKLVRSLIEKNIKSDMLVELAQIRILFSLSDLYDCFFPAKSCNEWHRDKLLLFTS